jgi:hypothetical protein
VENWLRNQCLCDLLSESGRVTSSVLNLCYRETYRIKPDDPLSASAETHWTQTLRCGDWSVRTEAMTMLKADKDFFHLTGSVEAYEDGKLVHEKRWNTKIKREMV